ncbi:MAG: MarR family transcriptional regulator [Bacteroidota bacterium]
MSGLLSKRIKQEKFEGPHQEAYLNLMVASGHMRQRLEETCDRFDITSTQYNVLRILKGGQPDGYPRAEVICRMIERAPDVTRLIDRLEDQGFVARERSSEDRRLSIAKISQKGLDLLKQMEPEIRAANESFKSKLTAEEAQLLTELCEKIYGQET